MKTQKAFGPSDSSLEQIAVSWEGIQVMVEICQKDVDGF